MQLRSKNVGHCALLAGAVAGVLCASQANAATISVDFGGGGGSAVSTPMGPTETAGFLPVQNWNSFVGNVQATPQALKDSTGAATTGTVVWNSNNTWNTPNVPPVAPGDLNMMKGYLDSSDTSVTTVTVAGLPASITSAPYSVILYYNGTRCPTSSAKYAATPNASSGLNITCAQNGSGPFSR